MNKTLCIPRAPDLVAHASSGRLMPLTCASDAWRDQDFQVQCVPANGALSVSVAAAATPVERIVLRWREPFAADTRFFGDHWERGYGDLEWRTLVPERVMPWYFLACDGETAWGFGVRTGPAAFCFWTVDAEGFSLWLDLLARSGTPLFVSADPRAMGPEQRAAVKAAFAAAAVAQPPAEPLDWMASTCPANWKIGADTVDYDWYGTAGVNPVWM